MKRFLFSLLLTLPLFFTACKSKTVDVTEETYEDGKPRVVRTYNEDDSKREPVYEKVFYPDGKVQVEGAFKNRARDGVWIYYYENGNKWSEAFYRDGSYNGASKTWFENGNLRYEGQYKDGQKTGLWKFYKEDGTFLKEVTF